MNSALLFGRRVVRDLFSSRPRTRPSMRFSSDGHTTDGETSKINHERLDFDQLPDEALLGFSPSKTNDERLGFDQLPDETLLGFSASKINDEGLGFDQLPDETLLGSSPDGADNGGEGHSNDPRPRWRFPNSTRLEADQVIRILEQDGPGFDTRSALEELGLRVSNALVREVLFRILMSINAANKSRCAKLAYKFFAWSGQQEGYKHTPNAYNLTMKIFADSEELKAMWKLVDEMTQNGLPITARTFNILICTCGEAGMARKLVERFIKSKTFNYRPFKHCFNAILLSLLSVTQYRLIEWVYQQMQLEGHSPDILTYNVIMCAKYRLGKLDQFHRLLDEMGRDGLAPDLHTYNLLLHVLGRGDKPLAALNLLNYMNGVGCHPSVLHFTNLIDGLSRAGNLDACQYFFDEMDKNGCKPDVVCYTVMITGYVVVGKFDKAQELFGDMVLKGQLPNVFTYNSMIRGLCHAGKFDEACSMLKDMEAKGCTPNFSVYSTLVGRLRNAGKVSEANEIISHMVEKGHYLHLLSKFRGYRRC